jgi:SAM-dependent methyltransferase
MDPVYEQKYYVIEERHAWSRGRRAAILRLLESLRVAPSARVLEVGCGSGLLVQALRDRGFADVVGIDNSAAAVRAAEARGLGERVAQQDAGKLSFGDERFDVVIASDVLEHLLDDRSALVEWRRILAPGGRLVVFVPAFDFLWSAHDVANHHFRRYSRSQLQSVAERSGFDVLRIGYWNTALFFPILAMRMLMRVRVDNRALEHEGDFLELPAVVNASVRALFSVENALLGRGVDAPLGVSVFAVLQRPR